MKFGKTCDVQVISRAVHLNSAIEVHLNSAIEVQFSCIAQNTKELINHQCTIQLVKDAPILMTK